MHACAYTHTNTHKHGLGDNIFLKYVAKYLQWKFVKEKKHTADKCDNHN